MATTQDELIVTRKIAVYRDDPVWARHARWFNVPLADLERLHVVTYEITGNGYDIGSNMDQYVADTRKDHPGCVLVY